MRCGLLGERLGHSYSPQIHALLGDYDYTLFEIPPEELADFLKTGPFDGVNVTIPYKKAVIPYCTELSEAARRVGSVNTLMRLPGGGLFGDNTDCDGFRWLLERNGGVRPGETALVLGTGGASLTVQAVLRELGAQVVALSRRGERHYGTLSRYENARLVVNATPVGMYPNNGSRLICLDQLPRCRCVLDLIYNPARTRLLLDAEERGIPGENGLPMLVAQAKRAAERFTGRTIDDGRCEEILQRLRRQMENVILIGMPGCGKSTVGRALAERLNRPFLDADAAVEAELGCSIPAFFSRAGEAAFRAVEHRVLSELGRRSGVVIATGGGCVTQPENYPLLHQNGRILWLQRELSRLPLEGRPVSRRDGLAALSHRRAPLYACWSDAVVDNNGPLEQTLDAAQRALA